MEALPCWYCQSIAGWIGAVGGVLDGVAVGRDAFDGGVECGDLSNSDAGDVIGFGFGGEFGRLRGRLRFWSSSSGHPIKSLAKPMTGADFYSG